MIALLLYYSSLGGAHRSFFSQNRKAGLDDLGEILGECYPKAAKRLIQQLGGDIQHLITGKALEYVCNPSEHSVEKLKNDTLRLVKSILNGQKRELAGH